MAPCTFTLRLILIVQWTAFSEPLSTDRFDYENFFKKEIEKKKEDHTYRIFKKVSRRGHEFPIADEYTGRKKEITVWCSNDYLGMSWHPTVKKAVR